MQVALDPRPPNAPCGSSTAAGGSRAGDPGVPSPSTVPAVVVLAFALLLGLLATSGCASITAAQMELPEALAAVAPAPMKGVKPARRGEFELMGLQGRFERSADRLSLFDAALEFDRMGLSYSLTVPVDQALQASCRGRRTGAAVGVVAATPRPLEVQCDYRGAFTARFTVTETAAAAGTRVQRQGRMESAGAVLEVTSVHRVQGSPLPLAAPIGYTFTSNGRPVGAVEANGPATRVWITPAAQADPALRQAVQQVALSLALLWDPA